MSGCHSCCSMPGSASIPSRLQGNPKGAWVLAAGLIANLAALAATGAGDRRRRRIAERFEATGGVARSFTGLARNPLARAFWRSADRQIVWQAALQPVSSKGAPRDRGCHFFGETVDKPAKLFRKQQTIVFVIQKIGFCDPPWPNRARVHLRLSSFW